MLLIAKKSTPKGALSSTHYEMVSSISAMTNNPMQNEVNTVNTLQPEWMMSYNGVQVTRATHIDSINNDAKKVPKNQVNNLIVFMCIDFNY